MESLSKECFADQYNCKYPIYTKEAAEQSFAGYCKEKMSLSYILRDEIEANFKKAAAYHEIELKEPVIKEASVETNIIAEAGSEKGVSMPVIDSLGDEFLDYVKDGMRITVDLDGTVTVED